MGTHSSTEQSRTRVRIMCSGVGQHYTLEDPKSVWQLRRQRMDTLSKLLESIHFTFMKKYANLLTEFFPSLVLSKYEKKAKFVTRIMKEHLWNPLNVLLEIIMVFFMEWKPARNCTHRIHAVLWTLNIKTVINTCYTWRGVHANTDCPTNAGPL